MILHFIRHGKTLANEKQLYCGSTDTALCDNGVQELLKLKKQGIYPVAQVCMVSGLLRTTQTANILFENPALIEIPALCEISFGEFEMRSYEELKTIPSYQNWISDIELKAPPGGQSKPEFIKRVMRGFFEAQSVCKTQALSSGVIVTHGGVIATIMESLFSGQKNFYEWQPACGRGYTLSFEDTHNIKYTKI